MTVQLRWGGATDVGQVRAINQDSMLLGPQLFVVADGMGGHQGGEVASALAIESVTTSGIGPDVNQLISAVQDANHAVFERSSQDPALSGMGTTFVAIALVVEGNEEHLAVVNVGDSRAYRLVDNQLEQVTEDHSLVGELVREGRLTREEARTHPQKNIVTRAVGIDAEVAVDDFQILPHTGDRYLLCSDGLTDEVTDDDIATVLRTIDDPDMAAAELVRRANEHGGRDNITIVIVDVVDDGGISGRASALVPDAENFSESEDDTQTFLAVPDDRAHEQANPDPVPPVAPAPAALDDRLEDIRDDRTVRKQRAVTLRSVAFVVVILALVAVGGYLVNDYARNTYHVILDGSGEVVVMRGRPGGVLWFDPSLVERTGIDDADIPGDFRDGLVEGVSRPDLQSARRYVTNLEDRIEEITPTTTTTTTSAVPSQPADPAGTSPTVTAAPPAN